MSTSVRYWLVIAPGLASLAGIWLVPPIPQDTAYHQFAGDLSLLAIPNALNVITNLLFAWAGIEGVYRLVWQNKLVIEEQVRPAYIIFFASLILVALGSGHYHLSPDNQSLVWDRLPMTIAFMSFFTILCAERLSPHRAKQSYPLLLIAGIASIVYWYFSEQAGQGDLRPYVLVQFLPIALTPLILLLFPSNYSRSADIWWLFAWYLFAKLLEWLDLEIHNLLVVISGHNLKHVAAAIGCLIFLRHLRRRIAIK